MKPGISALILTLVGASLFGVAPARSQQTEPQFKLMQFYMEVLKRGPKWTTTPVHTPESAQLQKDHIAYLTSLLDSGKSIISGPLTDDSEIRGIVILRAHPAEEAKTWAEADPAVAAGHLSAEIHPWWFEDVMKKAVLPIKLTTAYLAILTRGSKWTPEQTPQVQELQKAHLANIVRLNELKKLVVAGPFVDNGQMAGIFVFCVGSLAEAQALADTDPAVKAGRLAIELHPWLVPEGVLPNRP
jgi:uncharacterized protein YciI